MPLLKKLASLLGKPAKQAEDSFLLELRSRGGAGIEPTRILMNSEKGNRSFRMGDTVYSWNGGDAHTDNRILYDIMLKRHGSIPLEPYFKSSASPHQDELIRQAMAEKGYLQPTLHGIGAAGGGGLLARLMLDDNSEG